MKVVISGYYGFGNVGDEAVLAAIIAGLRRRAPDIGITVLSATPQLTAELDGVRAVPRYNLFSLWREIGQADVLISGGGTLFQDVTGRRSFFYYLGLIVLAKMRGKKIMVFAQGFGPLRKKFNRWLAGLVLDRVELITVRDEDSLHQLKALGIKTPPVHLTGDPTGSLGPADKAEGRKLLGLEGIPLDKPLLGVAVRSLTSQPELDDELCRHLAAGLDRLVVQSGLRPVFLLFQCPEDMRETAKVMALMKERAEVVFKICRPEEMCALFTQFELVVALRLHALIFAALSNVPLLGLAYDPKVKAFMTSLGQPCIALKAANKIGHLLAGIAQHRQEISQELAGKREALRALAELNFTLFFETFAKEK